MLEEMVKVGKIFLIYDDGGDVQGGQNIFFPFKNEMVVVVIRIQGLMLMMFLGA